MFCVGIDLHRRRSQVSVVDERGQELWTRDVANSAEAFCGLLDELGDDVGVVVEATYGWEWLVELLKARGCDVRLSHPQRTRAIATARIKTDRVDANTLAQLLRADFLPEAYIAPEQLRDLRDLLRQRATLIGIRTALKNRVRGLLARSGIDYPTGALFSAKGRRFLAELDLRAAPRARLDGWLRLIDDTDRELRALTAELTVRARAEPRAAVLTELPGVGDWVALVVLAEVGDIDRFPTPRHLCSWAGLAPKVRSSDGRYHAGHITHQGSRLLRGALTNAAQQARRRPGPLKDSFERIAARRSAGVANVAIARRLLTLCYYGLRDGEIRALRADEREAEHDHRIRSSR